jgi:hypothetical protein
VFLNRLSYKAGAAIVSIGLSIFLWNYPLPDPQFWALNIIDLALVMTALAIPVIGTKEVSHAIRSQVERFGHAPGKHGVGSYQGHP